MQNPKSEKNKKILITLVVLALFGGSYYYYADSNRDNSKTPAVMAKKPAKTVKKPEKIKKVEAPPPPIEIKAEKTEKIIEDNRIKPTDKNDILARALGSAGKNDPFSYRESNFSPIVSSGKFIPDLNGLPAPPESQEPEKPAEAVVIKGFLGNKVIAQIKGFTESLAVNESLRGVRVLGIDSVNLSCDFEIDGKKVTRKMSPITGQNTDVDINYIDNIRGEL